jgi:hypothetical protein
MTVQEYLTTYNILFAKIMHNGTIIGHHYSKFYKFPHELLTETNFTTTRYDYGKVLITITK